MMQNESDEDDDWQPTAHNSSSLFHKIQMNLTDVQINKNLQQMLSKPIYFNDDDIDPEDRPSETQKHEALYNPLEDQQNEFWMRKNKKNGCQQPLSCPNCFTQVAYNYEILKNHEYFVLNPVNLIELETKVLRNRDCPDTVDLSMSNDPAKLLVDREEQFNIKIICACSCGVDIGYYDVNKEAYVLINVV